MLSNIAEVKARGAEVIAVATEGSGHVAAAADQTVFIPRTDWILQPILAVDPAPAAGVPHRAACAA